MTASSPQNILILGGGIAGLSFAYFYDSHSTILEKNDRLGGLSRSFKLNKISYDIGPHIIFSKNEEILNLHTSLIKTNRIRRSNQIFHKKKFVKYPFENDLASLSPQERDYCLTEFLNNPYEDYDAQNMLQFFLKTFGEGITRLYLQTYNEKIWKFDPAFMDMQMVERIPKPPKEDVIKSANGILTEGYTHQLYFHYPQSGGFQTLVDAYDRINREKCRVHLGTKIEKIYKDQGQWTVETNQGDFQSYHLLNCMPLHELFKCLDAPSEIRETLQKLKYNSIHIVVVQAKRDFLRDNFSIFLGDQEIIFHRVTKLNFLGKSYCLDDGGTTLLCEITFRPESYLGSLSKDEIQKRTIDDLVKCEFIAKEDVFDVEVQSFQYAYVIYDLDHRKNTDQVLNYLKVQGIHSCGRFAEFEYMNTDRVSEHSQKLAQRLNQEWATLE